MSLPLLRRELRANYKMILLFTAVITLYSTVIIAMYDPKLGASLNMMAESMPELFAAFGMTNAGATMLEFIINYLYGFLLVVIPMLGLLLIAGRLVVRYVDQGSMAYLLATPNTRGTIIRTQILFLVLCTLFLVIYSSGLGLIASEMLFPGELDVSHYLLVNAGLLCLHLFLGGMCFFFSSVFFEQKKAYGCAGGCLVAFLLIQMLSQVSKQLEGLRLLTPLTLFQAKELAMESSEALMMAGCLAILGVILYIAAAQIFRRRNLSL